MRFISKQYPTLICRAGGGLVQFVDGVFDTDDEATINDLDAYTEIQRDERVSPEAPTTDELVAATVKGHTLEALAARATDLGIDFQPGAKKLDLAKLIVAALQASDNEAPADEVTDGGDAE